MKKLKIVLQSNIFYIIFLIIIVLYILGNILLKENKSIFNINDSYFEGIINDYEFDGNKLTLELKGKETLIINYYINTYEELLDLKKQIKYGIKIKVKGQLKVSNNNTIPYAFNYKKYLLNNDIYYTLNIDNIEFLEKENFLYKIKNYVNDKIEKIDKTGYMKAFILGNKNDISNEVYTNYQKIGITHLFALSGMHIGLLSGIILKLFKHINDKVKYLIVSIILIIYGFIVGFPYSIKRCIIFFIINSINKIFNLNISSIKVLLLTIFIIIINNYKAIYDVGFIYSVLTVSGILISSNFIKDSNKIKSSFKLSLIAFLFSLPISLSNFYEVNFLSILYNIFFVPFVSIIVYPLSLLSFIIPILSNIFSFFISILEYSANLLSKINILSIYMSLNRYEIIVYYIILLITIIKKKYILFSLLIVIIFLDMLIPYLDSNSYIYFLDVGQGDSSLIITPHKKEVIMVDTGGIVSLTKEDWQKKKEEYKVSDNVITLLKALGIKKINSLVLTHGDYDHMGESLNYVNNFKIDKVIFNCGEFNELEQDLITILKKKNIHYYSCLNQLNDDYKLYFLKTEMYDNENDNSNVIYTEFNNYKFLLMGDASIKTEENILKKYNLEKIDVLKVGHHGSNTSSSKEFINKINPKYSIISVGQNNRYGHPNKEVLENLNNSIIYRTDQHGSIKFTIKNKKLFIENYEP